MPSNNHVENSTYFYEVGGCHQLLEHQPPKSGAKGTTELPVKTLPNISDYN